MDVGVVLQEAFHGSVVEVGSVVDSRNLAGRAAKDLGLPCVPEICQFKLPVVMDIHLQMTVEMDHSHGPVSLVDTAQQRQCDGMITPQSDNPRQSLSGPGQSFRIRIGERLAHQQAVMSFFNLLDGPSIVVSRPVNTVKNIFER